jgi:hypothetical protein
MHATKEQRSQFLSMIRQWQQSGLSQKVFCANNNMAYHVFHYWYGVYKSEPKSSGAFLPVNIAPTVSPEQIMISGLSGIQLQVPLTDQSVRFIKQLLLS